MSLTSVPNAKFLISGRPYRQELRVQRHTRIIEFSSVPSNPKFARKTLRGNANFGFGTLDHDEFGSNRSKLMNVIDSNIIARDSREKPVSTFSHPALVCRT